MEHYLFSRSVAMTLFPNNIFLKLMRKHTVSFILKRLYSCTKKGFPLRLALCDIPFDAIPASTYFSHPYGITIGKGTIIGENCIIGPNVTIGTRRPFIGETTPTPAIIGNNCFLGAGCVIIGGVNLPDGYHVGANKVIKGVQ